jgi:hypothetical protein
MRVFHWMLWRVLVSYSIEFPAFGPAGQTRIFCNYFESLQENIGLCYVNLLKPSGNFTYDQV